MRRVIEVLIAIGIVAASSYLGCMTIQREDVAQEMKGEK